MSRSDYYKRRSPRLLSAVKIAAAKDTSESEPAGEFTCALCHANLPVIRLGGLLFVQGSLGFFCKAPAKEVCPLRDYLATRIAT